MASDDELYSSDLTDLDEDYSSKSAKKGKGKGASSGEGGYKIRHALKAPRATTYSTEALYKQIHSGDINLEPDYQREVVWPESKQINIIDSIFRNFYIPPVIFAVKSLDDGTETKTCIDWKAAVNVDPQVFMDGLIPHKDPATSEKLWYRDNPAHPTKAHKKLLPVKYRNLFDNKAVVCVEYQDLKDADEREIFQRVQLGVALTPAEKLKVLTTPRAKFMRTLQETFLNKEENGLGGDALDWNRSRGSDFRCLAQTVTSINITEKWLAENDPVSPAFVTKVTETYSIFEALACDRKHTKVFKTPSKIAPIEFIAIGLLIAKHKDRLSFTGLASAISEMRANVRVTHTDIRNNSRIYKHLLTFILEYKGAALGRGEVTASSEVADKAVKLTQKAASAGTKRKKTDDQEGESSSDDDYAPARKAVSPRKRKAPAAAPPTPPASASTSAPASGTPPSGMDALRATLAAQARTGSSAGAPTAPRGGTPPFAFQDGASHPGYASNIGGYGPGQANGAGWGGTNVAAALEAGLMNGGPAWGGAPNGTWGSIKQESTGPPPLSGGSASNGRYGAYHDRGGEDRDRDRDRDRHSHRGGRDYDYDPRYRQRDRDDTSGRWGRR
ncbi:hypothetical protein C8J57DRAFT_1506303 [Mycena rebaudengoi]|nr:hypothetical protein C8J57DRAFT_1506303 [Mycena rebaudengoi]